MLRVVNRIDVCTDQPRERLPERIDTIMMHRFGGPELPYVHDAAGMARFFRQRPQWTGGRMAYPLVVQPLGVVEQAAELGDATPHAARWNTRAIGVACIGDFRVDEPPAQQWMAAVAVVASLARWIGDGYQLLGHDEAPGASSDPSKACPGKLWPMDEFRREVANRVEWARQYYDSPNPQLRAELHLLEMGLII